MKCDIEVVGERCRRRNEPRPLRVYAHSSWNQRLVIPEGMPDEKPKNIHGNGKNKRTFTAGQGSSWRHTVFYGREGPDSRRVTDIKEPISQEQSGMKVRISYVDYKGHVNPSPGFSRPGRSRTALDLDNGPDVYGHPEDSHGLSGWGSSVSISGLAGRLYRPKSIPSARDKILSSALDKHFLDNHRQCRQHFADADAENELINTPFTATSMPSIPTSRPQLTTSTPSTSPPPSMLPDAGQSADVFRANSISSNSNTPRSMTSNPPSGPGTSTSPIRHVLNGIHANGKGPSATAVMNGIRTDGRGSSISGAMNRIHTNGKGPVLSPAVSKSSNGKGPTVMNGIYAKGKGPTSSAVMNGVHKNGKGQVGSASTNKEGAQVSANGGLLRSVTTIPGKRVRFSLSTLMAEHLRNMYLYRRVQSAGSGGWQGPSGSVAMAFGRLRGRRKTVTPQTTDVDRDENAPPPVSRMFRKFRMVGFITVTLIRLKAAIVVNSLDRTERSAAEIQWRTLYGKQEAEKLAFSKSYYSRERITTKMPRWALEIFEVRPEERTEQDCRRLHALFRGMRSFDKFTEEIQLNLCRSFSYTCIEESRIVLRRGHIGHNFYFIYSGSVFVNVQDIDSDGEPFIKTEAILAHGDSFGELALLKDIRRTATVSVRETCELLVVDKDVFSQVCPMIFEKELMEKKNFISHLSLFSHKWWSADALSSLCMEAQIQEYKINKIVVENNTTEEWLYICMEGQCQVIRCLSEDGEEEGEEEEGAKNFKRGREQSVILSEEIIELLSSAKAAAGDRQEQSESETSKHKLLHSLGLEYVDTGKRTGAFLEEVEEEERRKAFLASSGPMTLTSLMARKEEEGKTGLVYIKVGTLESEDVFDIGSLIKPPVPRTHSALLLVSCGARMLRLKKSLFLKLASPQAMEHTRALVSKHPFPSEAAIVESYKRKVSWNAYKAKVVKDVVRSRDMRSAPLYRGDKKKEARTSDPSPGERSQTSKTLPAGPDSPRGTEKKTATVKDSVSSEEDDGNTDGGCEDINVSVDQLKQSEEQHGTEVTALSTENADTAVSNSEDDTDDVTDAKGESEVQPARVFPKVDTKSRPDTSRPDSAESIEDLKTIPPLPVTLQHDGGPAPEAVIVRRKSSLGLNGRPLVSVDTTFVTRRRRSRDDSSSGHVTRFNLANDLDSETVAEKA